MATKKAKEYVPFGREWKKEMMKMKKSDLINFMAKNLEERCDLLAGCEQLINADHYDHFAVRLNDQEMKGIEMIKDAIKKATTFSN